MAISYPLATPVITRHASVIFAADDAVAKDQSPFDYSESVQDWGGKKWRAEVQLPTMNAACSSEWEAFLTALRGRYGTFLLGDPSRSAPRGTATSATISGAAGAATVSVGMTGTLLASDMLQIGSGASARLYKVLVDQSGNGSLEIWPNLRVAASSASAVLVNPKGVFRLSENSRGWSVSNFRWRRIAFSAEEVV
jgi:hypothetical protein